MKCASSKQECRVSRATSSRVCSRVPLVEEFKVAVGPPTTFRDKWYTTSGGGGGQYMYHAENKYFGV